MDLGWNDPRWSAIYPTRVPVIEQAMARQAAHDQAQQARAAAGAPVHYLDQLQAAAARGEQLDLSSLSGFRTNMTAPESMGQQALPGAALPSAALPSAALPSVFSDASIDAPING